MIEVVARVWPAVVIAVVSFGTLAATLACEGDDSNTNSTILNEAPSLDVLSADVFLDRWLQADIAALILRLISPSSGNIYYIYSATALEAIEPGHTYQLLPYSICNGRTGKDKDVMCAFLSSGSTRQENQFYCEYAWVSSSGTIEFQSFDIREEEAMEQRNRDWGPFGSFSLSLVGLEFIPLAEKTELFDPRSQVTPSFRLSQSVKIEPVVQFPQELYATGSVWRFLGPIDFVEEGRFGEGCR